MLTSSSWALRWRRQGRGADGWPGRRARGTFATVMQKGNALGGVAVMLHDGPHENQLRQKRIQLWPAFTRKSLRTCPPA